MKDLILGQILGFITGIIVTLLGHFLYSRNKLKLKRKTFQNNRTISEIKDIFKSIYNQFSLGQTMLIDPIIPQGQNFSRKHSHTQTGYFNYLGQNNIPNYTFKYWDKDNESKFIEVEVEGNRLTIESHLLPWEAKKIHDILKKRL